MVEIGMFYTRVLEEYDLLSMLERLNTACGTDKTLGLTELQEIRHMVEQLATVQSKAPPPKPTGGLRDIPGFLTLKAMRHGRLWYIMDCTDKEPARIGPWCTSYGATVHYAGMWYHRHYS